MHLIGRYFYEGNYTSCRFFSAYEVLEALEKDYTKNQEDIIQTAVEQTSQASAAAARGRGGRGRGGRGRGGRGRGRGGVKLGANGLPEEVFYKIFKFSV